MRDEYCFDDSYLRLENAFVRREMKKFEKAKIKEEKARAAVVAKREEFAALYGRNR